MAEAKVMAAKKVLIVDDNLDFVKILEISLKKRGYEVVVAHGGEEGFKKAETERPGLILLDIKMPDMDGLMFVRRLKKNEKIREIPVVVLTGFEPMRDLFKLEGIADYFVKTTDFSVLLKSIERNIKS